MVVTCEISFDNNRHGTFYAGQLVNGCVTLKCDRSKEVQGTQSKKKEKNVKPNVQLIVQI